MCSSDLDWQSVYFSNILESFFLDGGLYAMPVGFSLSTFVGRQDMLGDRERWSIQEMVQIYMEREEGVILYPGETKADVFWRIFSHNMEYFIDWEKGRCSFDSEEFRGHSGIFQYFSGHAADYGGLQPEDAVRRGEDPLVSGFYQRDL